MHFHSYSWTGPGDDQRREGERRPFHPAFQTSTLPPMRTCDWLLKPRTRIDSSPATVAEALGWLAGRYQAVESSFWRPADEAHIGLDFRLAVAEESLAGGVDVQWGIWLQAGRFITAGVVCCSPNRHATYTCPARR
ncbi:hypothetical protein AB0O34_10040 [Sphaerisporangium sp. NPDC088356]|uniref:hypothetical protein n=1 Tax=Sphaerisporangium sp. NPDC088356 TaxID=3154871 RepID=UPI003416A369